VRLGRSLALPATQNVVTGARQTGAELPVFTERTSTMTSTSSSWTWGGVAVCLLLPLTLVALGCGGGSGSFPTAEVNGKVTYNGKPVTGGSMAFFLASDASKGKAVAINDDGTYSATGVPVGEIKVTVETDSMKPSPAPPPQVAKVLPKDLPEGSPYAKPKEPKLPANYVPIPAKYNNPNETPLKYTINKGTQTIPIELK
jgi:hypothetical protein